MNIKSVFLYNKLNKKIYIKLLYNYINTVDKNLIYKLQKLLYNLKQALRN